MYAVCLLAVTMHAIIVKKSPIRNVLYDKWLEVIRINQVPQLRTVCLLAVTMHGITIIIVKKSRIQDVLYGKWLEVHDQSEIQLQRKYEGFEVCMLCAYLQLPCVLSLSL